VRHAAPVENVVKRWLRMLFIELNIEKTATSEPKKEENICSIYPVNYLIDAKH